MVSRAHLRSYIVAAATALLLAGFPSTAMGVGFGLGDHGLDAYAGSSSFHTLCGWNGTSCGHGAMSITYTRIDVPYNALATYDSASGGCVSTVGDSNNWVWHDGAQEATGQSLYSWLGAAEQDGLDPIFSITWGNPNLRAEADNPGYPTANGYLCGLEALMQAAGPGWNRWVHEWEVFNEPESGICASDAANYALMASEAAAQEGRSSDTFVAGAFWDKDDPLDGSNHPDCGHPSGDWFISDYVSAIKAEHLSPAVWSWHPYTDVDASYSGTDNTHQTGDLASYLNKQFRSRPQFWITEAAIWLNDHQYGQDLDGNPTAQANAAAGFENLANAPNQAYKGQIARLYWYEYQTYGDGSSLGSDTFDSALLGLTNTDWVEDGSGVQRASYCVLAYGDSPKRAVSDTRCDYASSPDIPWTDWQDPNG